MCAPRERLATIFLLSEKNLLRLVLVDAESFIPYVSRAEHRRLFALINRERTNYIRKLSLRFYIEINDGEGKEVFRSVQRALTARETGEMYVSTGA